MRETKLFCLPYAGGSASVFAKWRRRLPEWIELHPLELAGRGRRIKEPLPSSLEEAVEDLITVIRPLLGSASYALFGHSMGSLLAFELARRIRDASLPEPGILIVSGRSAPHIPCTGNVHRMSDEQFRDELLNIGGTPAELFETPSLSNLFVPIIRSDYHMIETYRFSERTERLRCEMIVMSGENDRTMQGKMEEWQRHTTGECGIFTFPGGHFFIHEQEDLVLELIANSLERQAATREERHGTRRYG